MPSAQDEAFIYLVSVVDCTAQQQQGQECAEEAEGEDKRQL